MDLVPHYRKEYLQTILAFIRSKTSDAGSDDVVVGLSGGLDSAVVVKLAALALGAGKVLALSMPESDSPSSDSDDAVEVSKWAGIELLRPSINGILDAFELAAGPAVEPMVRGNLKARIRMALLYYHANRKDRLVLGTSNKSELLIGYFTKYGDGGSDLAPIGDLYKTQVKKLARELSVPEHIITKPPTAGLVPDQTDEGELGMNYDVLDQILVGLGSDLAPDDIAARIVPAGSAILPDVLRIRGMVERARHKRKFPKIPKLSGRTVGWDRRE